MNPPRLANRGSEAGNGFLERLLFFAVILSPAFCLAILILKYSVNIPFGDEWDIAVLFEKISHGTLSFSDLIGQHSEHRLFFPKLLFILLATLTRWDVRYEMAVTFFLACALSFNLQWLNRKTIGGSSARRALVMFLSNLLILSPLQYQIWLMGMSTAHLIPLACLTTSLVVAYSPLRLWRKYLICMGLCTLATFSFASGVINWVVVFPLLISASASGEGRDSSRKRWPMILGIGFALNLLLYFYHYTKPPDSPSLLEAFLHPQQALHYFLAFLGSALGNEKLSLAIWVGGCAVTSWLLLAFYHVTLVKRKWQRTMGWLMLGVYAILNALLATFARVGFGVSQSLAPRYPIYSAYLMVSLIHLGALFVERDVSKGPFGAVRRCLHVTVSLALLLFVILQGQAFVGGLEKMRNRHSELLRYKACLLMVNFLSEEECVECLTGEGYPYVLHVKRMANVMNQLGFLKPPLVDSDQIEMIQKMETLDPTPYGHFDSLEEGAGGTFAASGWAALPERKEPAHAVILTYETEEKNATIFALAYRRTVRKEGWETSFHAHPFPSGIVKIRAWAFDALSRKVLRLSGSHLLKKPTAAGIPAGR